MIKLEKSEINRDEWLKSMAEKRRMGEFKYFMSLALLESDFEIYKKWLEACEELGLEYYLGYIETGERYKVIWGFSMFEIISMGNGFSVSHYFPMEDEEEIIAEMAIDKYEKSSCFLLSGAQSSGDFEEDLTGEVPRVNWDEILDVLNNN